MINETLGKWHTIDFFVGLAYLSNREALEYPAADICGKGINVLRSDLTMTEQLKLLVSRCMRRERCGVRGGARARVSWRVR